MKRAKRAQPAARGAPLPRAPKRRRPVDQANARAAPPCALGRRAQHRATRQRQERSPPGTGAHSDRPHAASRCTDQLLTRACRVTQALSSLHLWHSEAAAGALPGAAAHPGWHRVAVRYWSLATMASAGGAAPAPAAGAGRGASLSSTAARSAGASSCVLPSLVRGSAVRAAPAAGAASFREQPREIFSLRLTTCIEVRLLPACSSALATRLGRNTPHARTRQRAVRHPSGGLAFRRWAALGPPEVWL